MRTGILLLGLLVSAALPMAADGRTSVVVDADMTTQFAPLIAAPTPGAGSPTTRTRTRWWSRPPTTRTRARS